MLSALLAFLGLVFCGIPLGVLALALASCLLLWAEASLWAFHRAAIKPLYDLVLAATRYYDARYQMFVDLREVIVHNEYTVLRDGGGGGGGAEAEEDFE